MTLKKVISLSKNLQENRDFCKQILGVDYENEISEYREFLKAVADKYENGSVLRAMRRLLREAEQDNKSSPGLTMRLSAAAVDLINEEFESQSEVGDHAD